MTQKKDRELVVLLHGILGNKIDMVALDLYLKNKGYDTINVLYPSRSARLENIAEHIHECILEYEGYHYADNIHFVTHSMGGLSARYYIAAKQPENLGKVVMLSPPNNGNEIADFLTANDFLRPAYEFIFGPASSQLTTTYKHSDSIDYPLGVIAGTESINPLAFIALKGEHDGIVSVESTKIEGMTDHITLPTNHNFMVFDKKVIQQVHHFLQHGHFQKEENPLKTKQTSNAAP